jgi:hypothetical protein
MDSCGFEDNRFRYDSRGKCTLEDQHAEGLTKWERHGPLSLILDYDSGMCRKKKE